MLDRVSLSVNLDPDSRGFIAAALEADFDCYESRTGVIGGLGPATLRFEAQRKNNRGSGTSPAATGEEWRDAL